MTNHVLPQLDGTHGPLLLSKAYDTLAENAVGQNTIIASFLLQKSVCLIT